jgi:hypothetical protein
MIINANASWKALLIDGHAPRKATKIHPVKARYTTQDPNNSDFSSKGKANFTERLLDSQKPLEAGMRFPSFKYNTTFYKPRDDGTRGFAILEETIPKSKATIYFVVPSIFDMNSNAPVILPFRDVYKDGHNLLSKHKIPTFVISRDTIGAMRYCAYSLGTDPELLRFIPDSKFELMHQLGVLRIDDWDGLHGTRSVFYVNENNIILETYIPFSHYDDETVVKHIEHTSERVFMKREDL